MTLRRASLPRLRRCMETRRVCSLLTEKLAPLLVTGRQGVAVPDTSRESGRSASFAGAHAARTSLFAARLPTLPTAQQEDAPSVYAAGGRLQSPHL